MFMASFLRNESLRTQHLRSGLVQDLPRHCWVFVADLRELAPELLATVGLYPRGWNVLHRALITRCLNRCRLLLHTWVNGLADAASAAGFHFSGQTVAWCFHRIRSVLAEEFGDVLAENRGVRQHDVVRRIVFCSGLDDGLVLVNLTTQLLDCVNRLGELTRVLLF